MVRAYLNVAAANGAELRGARSSIRRIGPLDSRPAAGIHSKHILRLSLNFEGPSHDAGARHHAA